jgi:hypothetical protein
MAAKRCQHAVRLGIYCPECDGKVTQVDVDKYEKQDNCHHYKPKSEWCVDCYILSLKCSHGQTRPCSYCIDEENRLERDKIRIIVKIDVLEELIRRNRRPDPGWYTEIKNLEHELTEVEKALKELDN